MTHHKSSQSGFALLMTLLVVAVVVSITVTVIELTLKQLALSVTAKDSEVAFHAANAGMECARYVRRNASTTINAQGSPVLFDCFGQTNQRLNLVAHSLNESGGDGEVYRYEGEVSWITNDRCSVIDFVTMIVDETATGDMNINNFNSIFPGFPASEIKSCPPGGICTVAEVTGYNRPCGSLIGNGVVRREILLEF